MGTPCVAGCGMLRIDGKQKVVKVEGSDATFGEGVRVKIGNTTEGP